MTGCSVKGCSNRPEKGFKMHKFPRDPQRRRAWVENIKQTHVNANGKPWTATIYAQVCEVHFEEDQYEQHRADRKRKLKFNAVPTIFGDKARRVIPYQMRPVSPAPTPMPELPHRNPIPHDHAYSASPPPPCDAAEIISSAKDSDEELEAEGITQGDMTLTDSFSMNAGENKLTRMRHRLKMYRTKLQQLKREKKTMLKRKARLENHMQKLFGRDQLEALNRGSMRGIKWSTETIQKALALWQMCGSNGYEYLLIQHYPLPSIRTLQRSMEEHKPSQDLDEVVCTSCATLLPHERFEISTAGKH
ncbi:THAP domain-containing protein 11-like [Acanthaster planci]|uniref:THAP domain-containing protein 11-like n=1 Tax=Acanthaster planci TaxID=133434 RepID=A0A8B7ZAA8_ACAPL|nr:THAP domain-containing protein 11-like [Acanthaster planci]